MPEEENNTKQKKQRWLLIRALKYTRDNKCFFMVLRAFFWSAIFRLELLILKPKKMKKHWGTEKEESGYEEPDEHEGYVRKVARAILCVCNNTKWESKCLVRALVAQKLLSKKGLGTTLYLGVYQDKEGKMTAHAWLRWRKIIVTGGEVNINKYAIVSRFKK